MAGGTTVIIDFREAQRARETPAPKRISDDALSRIRAEAEMNCLNGGEGWTAQSWRDMRDALVELQDLRQEKRNGW
jgi:hypothetical protein